MDNAEQRDELTEKVSVGLSELDRAMKDLYGVSISGYVDPKKIVSQIVEGKSTLSGSYRTIIDMVEDNDDFMAFHGKKYDCDFMKVIRNVFVEAVN